MQRILVAVDFSETSQAVVELAAALASGLRAELTLLHVAAPEPDFVGYEPGPQTERDARAREFRSEHRQIQALADALRERGLPAKALLLQGPTVETLVAEARRTQAGLIVMGWSSADMSRPPAEPIGRSVPAVTLTDHSGQPRPLADHARWSCCWSRPAPASDYWQRPRRRRPRAFTSWRSGTPHRRR